MLVGNCYLLDYNALKQLQQILILVHLLHLYLDQHFFFLIGIHPMQGWTATTRHGVARKKAQKRLQNKKNLFRKNLYCFLILKIEFMQSVELFSKEDNLSPKWFLLWRTPVIKLSVRLKVCRFRPDFNHY